MTLSIEEKDQYHHSIKKKHYIPPTTAVENMQGSEKMMAAFKLLRINPSITIHLKSLLD